MTMALPARSKPFGRSASRCRRPRYRTARSRSARHHQPQRPPTVPTSLQPVPAQALAWPRPWRSSEQPPVLVRGMPPHTPLPQQPEMSVFATRTTGSLIIVTGRWPKGASRCRRWIAGKCFLGKAVTSLSARRRRFVSGPFSESKSAGFVSIADVNSCINFWIFARAAVATAHRSIAEDLRRRNCASARRHPAPPSRH